MNPASHLSPFINALSMVSGAAHLLRMRFESRSRSRPSPSGAAVGAVQRKQGGGAQVKGTSGPGACGQQTSPSVGHSSTGEQSSPDERKQGGGPQVKGASGPGSCGQQISPATSQSSAGSQTPPEAAAPPAAQLDGRSTKGVNTSAAKTANGPNCLLMRAPFLVQIARPHETNALPRNDNTARARPEVIV